MVTEEYLNELKESMAKRSIESLVEEFNQQVGNTGWTSIRGVVLAQHINHIVGCCKIPVGVQVVQQEPEFNGWHAVTDDNVFAAFIHPLSR